jgi:hypothetical protein
MRRGDVFGGLTGRGLAFLCLIVVAPAIVSAGPVSYELRLSENAFVTVDPLNPSVLQQAASVSQHELFSMRDMPYLQLMNTSPASNSASEITRFSLTIGNLMNNQQHFDWVRVIDASPGITVQFVMPDTVNNGVRSDAIDVLFTGFTPGKLVRFQTDIDNDQGNVDVFTDFRQVLFDLGGTSTADNAVSTVHFREPGLPPGTVQQVLPDFAQLGPTNLGFRLISECGPESVQPYSAGGSLEIIPEPSTFVLLSCGLVGLVAYCRRRPRQA